MSFGSRCSFFQGVCRIFFVIGRPGRAIAVVFEDVCHFVVGDKFAERLRKATVQFKTSTEAAIDIVIVKDVPSVNANSYSET